MLKISNARKTFNAQTPEEVQALRGIDLEIADGDFLCVIGSNGSGKSTLLSALAGAILLDSGQILIDGVDVTRWPDYRRARMVGRVFQNPFQGTAPKMSIAENFALAALRGRRRGLGWALPGRLRRQIRDRVSELHMGLEDRLDEAIGALSGGQRQALTLLMATWLKPRILLLDEHTAALDPKSADQLIQLTMQIVERHRQTTLMVTHSMHQAAKLGNRLIMMHRGQIVRDFRGPERLRLRSDHLLAEFEEIRQRERLDPSAAELLRAAYV
jgi:putative ABC transport system ATP-binding protein